jgi:hypothetical protein
MLALRVWRLRVLSEVVMMSVSLGCGWWFAGPSVVALPLALLTE